jgi:RHH-type rel operon transcriptional repressor/antitoxin RelB
MQSTPFTLRLDTETKTRLEAEAKVADRSASYVVQEAIKSYLTACESKRQAIEAALVEADKGEFVSSDAVETWFDNLGTENELPKPKPDVFI